MPYPNKSHAVSPTIIASAISRAKWRAESEEYLRRLAAVGRWPPKIEKRVWELALRIRKRQPIHLPWPIYPWCIKQAAIELSLIPATEA